jgi:hypothetical protein
MTIATANYSNNSKSRTKQMSKFKDSTNEKKQQKDDESQSLVSSIKN